MPSLDALRSNDIQDVAALIDGCSTGPLILSVEQLLPFQEAMELEKACLDKACFPFSDPSLLVWSMPQCLVVPRALSINERFETASAEMAKRGWPVYIRQTGGDLTPQAPGVINISYIVSRPKSEVVSISSAYEELCEPIMSYLNERLKVSSYCSSVEGAFCDGKFNVVIDGLKLAGTAQKWRQFRGPDDEPHVAIVGHAAILADVDMQKLMGASNEFYQLCGIDKRIEMENHITLRGLCGASNFDQLEIMDELAHFYEMQMKRKDYTK